jgi:hypothetical protein
MDLSRTYLEKWNFFAFWHILKNLKKNRVKIYTLVWDFSKNLTRYFNLILWRSIAAKLIVEF